MLILTARQTATAKADAAAPAAPAADDAAAVSLHT